MKTAIVSVALVAAVLGGLGWSAHGSQLSTAGVRFTGVSASGDYQAALDDALVQADEHFIQLGSDILYTWQLVRARGARGGFAGLNELHVTIRADADI